MTKSNEKVTPEVIEFSVTEVEKEFDKQYGKKAKKAGEYYYPVARAIFDKVTKAVKSKSGLSRNEVKDLYTSMAVKNETPNRYPELELAGNMLKIDGNKAGIKYLQDCINMAGLNALDDELEPFYFKKPEHRRSLQNGGLGEHDKFLSMRMLPVLKMKGGNNKEKETTVTHLLPSITGSDVAITENASDNWFYSLEKDIKTGYFVDAQAMANLTTEKLDLIEKLDVEFWLEVHARIRAKQQKLTYEGYLKVNKAKAG